MCAWWVLLYSAALLIVKSGPWDRDDPRKNYNSDIDYYNIVN
jgi:hypothetical protein